MIKLRSAAHAARANASRAGTATTRRRRASGASPAGRPVDPTKIQCPTLVLVPEADRIVPPAAALALSAAIPGAEVHTHPLGHIGMVVSNAAKEKVWEVVRGWVENSAV